MACLRAFPCGSFPSTSQDETSVVAEHARILGKLEDQWMDEASLTLAELKFILTPT